VRFLKRFADVGAQDSLATRVRSKRTNYLFDLLATLRQPKKGRIKLLDVGGTPEFWARCELDQERYELTILNIHPQQSPQENISCVVGDARDMSEYEDESFDAVISDSVIEHVGSREDQMAMAKEIQRVGGTLFLQTPNLWFPIETHFLMPWFQFYPVWLRVWILRHFGTGGYSKIPDKKKATEAVVRIKLFSKRRLRRFFPESTIERERILGLSNGFIVVNGWPSTVPNYRTSRRNQRAVTKG